MTQLTRRDFLKLCGASSVGLMLAACGVAPTSTLTFVPTNAPTITNMPAPTSTFTATATPRPPEYSPGSFRPAADKFGFKMGVCVAYNDFAKLNAAGLTQKLIGNQYNRLTVEGINPKSFMNSRDNNGIRYDFTRADAVAKHGLENNMDELGQHLSWWRSQEVPPWVNDIRDKSDADAVLLDVTTNLVKHFSFTKWTINEYGQRYSRTDVMEQKWGTVYLFRVAEIAKSINPDIKIFYNDSGGETTNPFSDRDYALMQQGVAKGLFDGIYFQGHFGSKPLPTYEEMVKNFERFRRLNNGNFQIGISEFGVDEAILQGSLEQKLSAEADLAEAVLRAVLVLGGESFSVTAAYDGSLNKVYANEGTFFDANGNPKSVKKIGY